MDTAKVVMNSVAGGLLIMAIVIVAFPLTSGDVICGSALFPNFADAGDGVPVFRYFGGCTSAQNGAWTIAIAMIAAAVVLFVVAARRRPATVAHTPT